MSNFQHGQHSEALSRRAFQKGLGGGIILAATGKSVGNLLGFAVTGEALAQDSVDFFDYHAVTPAFHRQQTGILPRRGFRLVSLSLYDFLSEPRYAAVWLRQSGSAQRFCRTWTQAVFSCSLTLWPEQVSNPPSSRPPRHSLESIASPRFSSRRRALFP
jgi:Polyglycine hydrolase-like, structural repeat